MADSQTMRSQQPQPNNANTQVTVGLQLAYFKTKPAILKVVSVVVGLLAMSLTAAAYNEAHYFTLDYETRCKVYEPHKKVCPIALLVTPFVFVLAFTWTGTCVMLIVLLFIDLNKKQPFPKVDLIGHFVAGGLSILSGLCLLVYVITVFIYAFCENDGNTPYGRGPRRKASNNTHDGKSRISKFSLCTTCRQCESQRFGHWHILFGGLFALAAGALYIVIALFLKKGSGSRPMMMGQGQRSMPPSQAQMQTQGTPSQQANSVKPSSPSMKTGSPSQAAADA